MTRRADRLFELIQLLRRARAPITASTIAAQLETSKSTVYRDVATLIARRVPIRGEAGTGYVLDRSFEFPPLAFTPDELQATVLGVQWVVTNADSALARAASSVLSKLAVAVPKTDRHLVDDPVIGTAPRLEQLDTTHDVPRLRQWCHQGWKAFIHYTDAANQPTERVIWPFLVGYQDGLQVLIAWCELRQGFRIFRLDRVTSLGFLDEPYAESPATLRSRFHAELETRRSS